MSDSTRVHDELILLPSIKAHRGTHGGLVLTRKFLNGARQYEAVWPGRVTTLIDVHDLPTSDMDHVDVPVGSSGARIEFRPEPLAGLRERVRDAAVVLMFLSPYEEPAARLCAELEVPVVFYAEYSPRTERQIVEAETRNPIVRWRRKLWLIQAERKRRRMLQLAAGIQCSGAPVYEAYRRFNRSAMLFFDSRVPASDVMDMTQLAAKAAGLAVGRPLRLVFGGRLVAMKGVMHLPLVAEALRRLGVRFQLDIYGAGALKEALARDIARRRLEHCVALKGVLDFQTEWLPMLKSKADIFVCCHPQGDPSSTYPEVMSCGVPIAGYDNEAFKGIVQHSGSGWLSAMHEPEALARLIARLDGDHAEIARAAAAARGFAEAHSFERTFAARTQHLIELSRLTAGPRRTESGGGEPVSAVG